MNGPWHRIQLELQLPAELPHTGITRLLVEEANDAGMLSAGLVDLDRAIQVSQPRPGVRAYTVTFLAEAPLDADHVAAILVRRLGRRFADEGIPWYSAVSQRSRLPRGLGLSRCRKRTS